jgi:hypothetical protein
MFQYMVLDTVKLEEFRECNGNLEFYGWVVQPWA